MFKIKILSVGKTKEAWLEQALNEYIKRLQPIAAFEFVWAKNDKQLLELVGKEGYFICLDANGMLMSSEKFSGYLIDRLEKNGSRLTLVIGGAEGLPAELKAGNGAGAGAGAGAELISLSPMTLTHQATRLILLEQIYRAFEIARGSKYHK
jgi:23S rRNA (pseudouridine1915-N3)-methyltransferase